MGHIERRLLIAFGIATSIIWVIIVAMITSPPPSSGTERLPTLVAMPDVDTQIETVSDDTVNTDREIETVDEAVNTTQEENIVTNPQIEPASTTSEDTLVDSSQTQELATDNTNTETNNIIVQPVTEQNLSVADTQPQQPGGLEVIVPFVGQPSVNSQTQAVANQVVLRFDANTTASEREAIIASANGTVVQTIEELNTVVIEVPANSSVNAMAYAANVTIAEPNYYVSALSEPNDPFYPQQWALPVVNAPDAWDALPADAPNVTIAVVDSGVDATHPDLVGRVGGGWDFVDDDGSAQDDSGHGTAITGIIAANANNHEGIAGIAPNVSIMPLRVLDANGAGTYADVAAAIVYATDNGAQIINLSLGGSNPSSLLADAVDYAVARGVMIVAAAGNTGSTQVLYPAAYANVVAVGSVDDTLNISSFSNHGSQVDLYAPGRTILTTGENGSYSNQSGTSIAAAHVSAVAAVEIAFGNTLTIDGGIVQIHVPPVADEPVETEEPVETAEPTEEPIETEEPVETEEPPSATEPPLVNVQALEGYLNIAYGDPMEGSNEPARFVAWLTDGVELIAFLNIDRTLALQFQNNFVTVIGEFEIQLPAIQSDETPTFNVESISASPSPSGQAIRSQALLSGSQPFVMVLCRFQGDPSEPNTPEWYEGLFDTSYPGLDHYWRQISYDNINLNGTIVTDQWYEMPGPRTDYINMDGDALLSDLAVDCANAADDDVNFPDFVGIHFVFNDSLDCCAWGGGVTLNNDGMTVDYRATWLPPFGQDHDLLAHEMGHAFGFPHSSGPHDNPPSDLSIYVSDWDVMSDSGGTCFASEAVVGGCLGQGTISFHLSLNEWIPGGRQDSVPDGDLDTFTLGPPHPLQADGSLLLVTVPINDSTEAFYTVEIRNRVTGLNIYDQNIPQDAVIIHDVLTTREGNTGPALVVDADDGNDNINDAGAIWTPGETYHDVANNIFIAVLDQTTTGGNDPINATVCIVNDAAETTAPVSSHEFTGTLGNNGFWRSNVGVELTATDDCTNPETIFYTVDGGAVQEYTGVFIVGGDGSHTVTYWAVDYAGNVEATNVVNFDIDTTPPETTETLDGTAGNNGWWTSDVTVTLNATDNFSGVFETTYRLDGGAVEVYTGPFIVTGEGEHTLQFSSEDNAGNFEDVQEITIKIDTVPPVIDISTDQTEYTRVELITFAVVAFDPEPGSGLFSVVAEFEGDIISDGTVIDPFWFDLGVYNFTGTAEDFAGLTSTDDGSFELIATLESLAPTIERLCAELEITNICNGLLAKVEAALAAEGRGQSQVAVNQLNALLHQLNAQNGNHVSADAFHILNQDIRYVIESLGGVPIDVMALSVEEAEVESLTIETIPAESTESPTSEPEVESETVETETVAPTEEPTTEPTATEAPTEAPTETDTPTAEPTSEPTATEPVATEPPTEAPTEPEPTETEAPPSEPETTESPD